MKIIYAYMFLTYSEYLLVYLHKFKDSSQYIVIIITMFNLSHELQFDFLHKLLKYVHSTSLLLFTKSKDSLE
jgi:hypothetical protein